ncbi:TIGR03668 family PPOX class F420-dependent oxidoreductase [Streptomyces sp. HPF1205]|uniref:TIGR03668 family PPOX class F420-dependent oxidoreductase n=1 Tax=Streptomyces sp. HPF1205 TaxID=2873262 RepID=UPI001CED7A8E|nr:TIGR03668 family PPOX class F420-dependent oxidoreductase [Streptomyces sp. HPF1205]
MKLSPAEARRRFLAAPVARLATASADGRPHLVPVTFAADGDTLCFAVDRKSKSGAELRRIANIRENPRVALLVDHYDDDWTALWWARADGEARVGAPAARGGDDPGGGPAVHPAVRLLTAKYPQYARQPPTGPVVVIRVTRWSGWSYAG